MTKITITSATTTSSIVCVCVYELVCVCDRDVKKIHKIKKDCKYPLYNYILYAPSHRMNTNKK